MADQYLLKKNFKCVKLTELFFLTNHITYAFDKQFYTSEKGNQTMIKNTRYEKKHNL